MQQQHTILVIDDDCRELDIMSDVLSSAGYRVLIAEDGDIGYHRAIFARPDLILLDVMMPGVDGYETCKKLRANDHTRNIPIFFKTCLGQQPSTLINGFRAGVDNVIAKPCNHDTLLYLIKSRLTSIRQSHLQNRLPILYGSALR